MKYAIAFLTFILLIASCQNDKVKDMEDELGYINSNDVEVPIYQPNDSNKEINQTIENEKQDEKKPPLEVTEKLEKHKEEIEVSKPDVELKSEKTIGLENSALQQIIHHQIFCENSQNKECLSNVLAKTMINFKGKKNIPNQSVMEEYQTWWRAVRSEQKAIKEIIRLEDYKFLVNITNELETNGGVPETLTYSIIYELDKNGKITSIYSN